jgi:hypothetical protein
MITHADKRPASSFRPSQERTPTPGVFQFKDERPEAVAQRKIQDSAKNFAPQHGVGLKLPAFEKIKASFADEHRISGLKPKWPGIGAAAFTQRNDIHLAPEHEKQLKG